MMRIFKYPRVLFSILRNRYNYLSCLYVLNIGKWLKKEVILKDRPSFNQRLRFTGAGEISIGLNCILGYKLGGRFYGAGIELQSRYKNSRINIGNNVSINNNLYACSADCIEIGDDTLIGENVTLIDHDAHHIDPNRRLELGTIGKITIGKNVWIGNNVSILKNTVIGDNTIVAAGSIVSGTFGSNVIIGGVPAKFIKNIDV